MVMRLIGDTAGQLTRMAKEIPHTVVYTQQYKLKVEKERGGGGVVASKVVITQRLAGYQS